MASDNFNPAHPKALLVAFLFFEGYELLDSAGPMEMFSALAKSISDPRLEKLGMSGQEKVEIITVAEHKTVKTPHVFDITVDYTFDDCPRVDLLVVPGGFGVRQQVEHEPMVRFLRKACCEAFAVLTVCTGSALLARTGLLDGHTATSNKMSFGWAMSQGPHVKWQKKGRWVRSGRYYTSGGVSAGMDAALAVIADMRGRDTAVAVAKYTEYQWSEDPMDDPFSEVEL